MSTISLFIAIGLVWIGLPLFNILSGKDLSFSNLGNGFMLFGIFWITVLTGFLAGSYPALFISSYQPVHVLKGQYELRGKSVVIRRVLVVFQFSASIILLVGTLVIFNQLRFVQNKNLGFNKEQILVLNNKVSQYDTANSFRNEMLNYPQVINGTVTGFLPIPSSRTLLPIYPEGTDDTEKWPPINIWTVDHDYIETLEISIISGRDFSRDRETDVQAAVINQSAAKYFGWDKPLEKRIFCMRNVRGDYDFFTVIGIVEDFHFDSLRDSIKPLILTLGESASRISFRIQTDDIAGTLDVFKRKWKDFFPNEPFVYAFLDEKFNDMYKSELRIGKVIGVFAGLAVFIGCLGLYGLASFTVERRTKEIGIRKVLGSSISRVVKMLLKEYLLLLVEANLVAWPVAYFIMKNWLQDFAYRTPLSVIIFISSGVITLALALVTVAYQAIKAALADPVKTLRYE
jgi:putative ABC transport system permease protein